MKREPPLILWAYKMGEDGPGMAIRHRPAHARGGGLADDWAEQEARRGT